MSYGHIAIRVQQQYRRVERRMNAATKATGHSNLLGAQLALVEGKLFTLEDVAISAAGLSGAGRDGGKQTT